MGSLWGHFGMTLGSLWDDFGVILGSLWDDFGDILESLWGHFGTSLGITFFIWFELSFQITLPFSMIPELKMQKLNKQDPKHQKMMPGRSPRVT